jgi:deazaflavin-dependent oxidoreductase (nitroreductase family)
MTFWRLVNPLAVRLAGVLPWWVVLETTGRRTKQPRRVPLARGPVCGSTAWLIAVHGRHAGFAHNIAAEPSVRLRMGGRWYAGHASVLPLDDAILRCFNRYARSGPQLVGVDPALLRIELQDVDARGSA